MAAECPEAGVILQGLLTIKSTKKQSRTHQPGLRYENSLSQPLNRVKKTGFFGLECLSPDLFSAYLIFVANNEIFAIKYDQNAVALSCELKTSSQKLGGIEGALVAGLISKINPLFAEVKKD